MKIGIDKIGFYTPNTYVDMEELALARDVDPGKYLIGIGQTEMAIAAKTQDSVTMAANAANQILDDADRQAIDMVLFGTESAVDHSKSGAAFIHGLTGIQPYARSVELKQACYSGTAAIQMAMGHITLNPESKVLVLASDIARYGLETGGEPTQGAGAVAMVISANPGILAFDQDNVMLTEDIMDFWRPIHSEEAYVDGQFSNEAYIGFFDKIWTAYKEKTGRDFSDFEALVFHVPYSKMGKKALKPHFESGEVAQEDADRILNHYEEAIIYNKRIGNIYTGSLYLSLISLLEQAESLEAGDRIGLFSYGSGAVGEFFSGILQEGYEDQLQTEKHQAYLDNRQKLSVEEYEAVFKDTLPKDGSDVENDLSNDPSPVVLAGVEAGIRQYKRQ